MAEEEDKPGQDATIQVSGSELEVLRQSAQLIAVSRDALGSSQDHQLRDETTLDLELKGDSAISEARDDDSTKAINRQSLVQIIKTEINASNPSGEAKPFGIMRRDERGAPSLMRPSKEPFRELGDEHSDQTQAIGKEELKLLRQSQNIALDELPQEALAIDEPIAQPHRAQPPAQALDETTLLERVDLDELDAQQQPAPRQDAPTRAPEARASEQAPAQEQTIGAEVEEDSREPDQGAMVTPSRSPWLLLLALALFLVGALLLIGLDVIAV